MQGPSARAIGRRRGEPIRTTEPGTGMRIRSNAVRDSALPTKSHRREAIEWTGMSPRSIECDTAVRRLADERARQTPPRLANFSSPKDLR